MEPTKRCPLCGEVILAIAVRCRWCQGDLQAHAASAAAAPAPSVVTPPPPAPTPVQGVPYPAPWGPPPYAPMSASGPVDATPKKPLDPVEDFEQRFLEYAFTTDYAINAPSVAFALKVPIEFASERLEDLAARDILVRDVDARGSVFFQLPGRNMLQRERPLAGVTFMNGPPSMAPLAPSPMTSMSPYASPPAALVPYGQSALAENQPPAPSEGTALAAILVNTLCLPGLGSIIAGRSSAGIGQLLLFLIGVPALFFLVGAPMILSAWIWGLITGIDVMNQAKQAQARRT